MKTIKFFAIAALFLGFSVSAMAQNPEVIATANAGARIITPLKIENTDGQSLEFGNIVASEAGGTVTVAPGATAATYDGVAAPFGLAGDIRAAKFTVTGDGSSKYTIKIAQVTALTSGSNTMELTDFTHNSSNKLTAGTETFEVGATLNVGEKQAAGTYLGSFKVTVAYE